MQRIFDWSEHSLGEIRSTGLTCYVKTYKGYLIDQNISLEKSEALDSQAMLEHARLFDWSEHSFWEIRGTELTSYVGTCKDDSLIRTFLLKNQRHWTHKLCWKMQRLFHWSEHSFWEIRATGLTAYVGTCKNYFTDQNIPFEKSEPLNSHPMLEHAKIIWLIRTFLLRNQRHWTHMLCKGYLTDQNIPFEKLEALNSHSMLEHARIISLIRIFPLRNQRHRTHSLCWNMQRLFHWLEHFFWEIRGSGLTSYIGTCKDYFTDQNTTF